MITALDHMVFICPDIEAGVEDYRVVMGSDPVWRARGDGIASAVFAVGNTALELLAPDGEGETADKLREMTAEGGKLTSLAYRTDMIDETHRLLGRRGLQPSDVTGGRSEDTETGAVRTWRRFRVPDEQMAGIKSFVLENGGAALSAADAQAGVVSSLDHIVINTPNPDRAVANYCARLGFRFALDRTATQWNTRFLFFRIGDLTIEIVNRLDKESDRDGDDKIWGVTWAVADLDAAHDRLQSAGREVSKIRDGRKPGSRVFTVRDGTLGVPTLFIDHAPS